MELAVANRPVEYYDNFSGSVSDSFELTLEGMNEIAHYLYYRFGEKLETQLVDTDIKTELINHYGNVEFEEYLYIATQRSLLCRIEEGIRHGYYRCSSVYKTEEGLQAYAFSLESDEKYKARSIGIFRREYQVRNHSMLDYRNETSLSVAYENLSVLADELISVQTEGYILLNFGEFHPDKDVFKRAEGVSEVKEHIVEWLTKDYYLNCVIKGLKVSDLLHAYKYLDTLSEVLYFASDKLIDSESPSTYIKEISVVDILYLATELSRIYGVEINYAKEMVDRFVFHEKNREDDIFAQPLLKIGKNQVILSQALLDQVNLDRFIERQFIRHKTEMAEVGYAFEKRFIDTNKFSIQEVLRK